MQRLLSSPLDPILMVSFTLQSFVESIRCPHSDCKQTLDLRLSVASTGARAVGNRPIDLVRLRLRDGLDTGGLKQCIEGCDGSTLASPRAVSE